MRKAHLCPFCKFYIDQLLWSEWAAATPHSAGLIAVHSDQGFGATSWTPLAALQRLKVLNLYYVHWTKDEEAVCLVAHMPRLRVLNAPHRVLVRLRCWPTRHWQDRCSASCCGLLLHFASHLGKQFQNQDPHGPWNLYYELPGLPHRRLRRWPRHATLEEDFCMPSHPVRASWPVLEPVPGPQRWLWDE